MTVYRPTSLLSEIRDAPKLSQYTKSYFQARLKNRVHQLVLRELKRQQKNDGFTKADLARRTGRGPDRVSRLLGSPGNWTLETISDLLLALRCELSMELSRFDAVQNTTTFKIAEATRQQQPELTDEPDTLIGVASTVATPVSSVL